MDSGSVTYTDRCKAIAEAMHRDNWPRLHSPLEDTIPRENGASRVVTYAQLYRAEMAWRLVWGADKGSKCPDQTGQPYETSWFMLKAHNERN